LLSPPVMEVSVQVSELWPHQAEAAGAACAELAGGGRCTLVAACGTGKTIVAAEVSRRVAATGRVLLVVPTLELLAQAAAAWAQWLGRDAGMIVAVCGDENAAAQADQIRAGMDHTGARVSTDPAALARVLAGDGRVTVLSTYASLPVIALAHRDYHAPQWDLVVADEAHRTAGHGGKPWAAIHHDAVIPAARRLYMTATPRIMASGGEDLASMDDPAVFGPVAHRLPFAQAISAGILADYRVVVAVVTGGEAAALAGTGALVSVAGRGVPARMAAAQIALVRAIGAWDLRAVITYHHRVLPAIRFAATLADTAGLMDAGDRPARPLMADYVTGDMTAAGRRERLAALADPGERTVVISNARVLAEGVDVPELDAVLFADPKGSAIDVVQAVGRALRRGTSAAKTATIIVPVLAAADAGEQALDDPAYDTVGRVVRALRAHDERIASWLDTQRASLHRGQPAGEPGRPPWLSVLGAAVTPAFAAAIQIRLVEAASSSWPQHYAALAAYHAGHGDASVPIGYRAGGTDLRKWLDAQCRAYRAGHLAPQRADALAKLGVTWSRNEAAWQRGLDHAASYHAAHGHLYVPPGHITTDGFGLYAWLSVRRIAGRDGRLTPAHRQALDALDIDWDPGASKWAAGLARLAAFASHHSHAAVPRRHVTADGYRLGAWLSAQRSNHDAGTLPPHRAAALEHAGVTWDPAAATWQHNLGHLASYVAEHGHARIPLHYQAPDGCPAGRWAARQRHRHRHPDQRGLRPLTAQETAALENLGMPWGHPRPRHGNPDRPAPRQPSPATIEPIPKRS